MLTRADTGGRPHYHVVVRRARGDAWIPFSSCRREEAEAAAERFAALEDALEIRVEQDFVEERR